MPDDIIGVKLVRNTQYISKNKKLQQKFGINLCLYDPFIPHIIVYILYINDIVLAVIY